MLTVLIADDHPRVRDVFRDFFRSFPNIFQVIGEVSNGKDAVRLVEEKNPDFVLMNITMPLVDGITATRIIKKELLKDTIVLTYTSYPKANLKEMAKKVGAREHFIKPLDLPSLKEKILKEYSLELKGIFKKAI